MQFKLIKKEVLFFVVISLCISLFVIYANFKFNKIEKNAVYTLGQIKSLSMGKSSASYNFYFRYRGLTYNSTFTGLGLKFKENDLVLVMLQSDNPKNNTVLKKYHLKIDVDKVQISDTGWLEIPKNILLK